MKFRKETGLKLRPGQNKSWYLTLLFLFFIVLNHPFFLYSQDKVFKFSQIPLSKALLQVSDQLKISVAFDSGKLDQKIISGDYTGENPSEIIQSLLDGSGFILQQKHGNYLIVLEEPIIVKAPRFNRIWGVLTDDESGEHLPFANVYLPELNIFQATSVNGSFSLKMPQQDSVHVIVNYIGFESIDSVFVPKDSMTYCFFRMKRKPLQISSVDIRESRLQMIDDNDEAGHITINPSAFANLPNMGETDVFRTIQMLPGVAYSENTSELSIRGSSADQNLILFDGFTLYNLDHFFGTYSSINPNVVKDIQVFKGGFDSRYGERLSGIVDITGKTGNKYTPLFYGGINLVSGNLTAEIPIGDKFTLVAAGRRAYSDIYSTYLMDAIINNQSGTDTRVTIPDRIVLEPSYYFYDYNAKLTYNKSEREKFSLSLFGSKDFLNSTGAGATNQRSYTDTETENEWGNYGLSLRWVKQWGSNLFSNFQIGGSGYFNKYIEGTYITQRKGGFGSPASFDTVGVFNTDESNELSDFSVSLQNTYTINLENKLDFGLMARNNWYSYTKNTDSELFYSDAQNSSWLYSGFVQLNNQSVQNLTIKGGGRMSYYNHSDDLYFEPRLSLTYRFDKQLALKFATGRYYQFLSKVVSDQYGYNRDFWVVADEKHPVLSSDHFIAGFNFTRDAFSFDVEAYYKTVSGLQTYLYIAPYQKNANPGSFNENSPGPGPGQSQGARQLPSRFTTGEGKAYGIDFLLKYEHNKYTGWISYSLSKALENYPDINDNDDIPSPYDRTHEFKCTQLFTLGKWNLSGTFILSTGQPYITSRRFSSDLTTTRTYDYLPTFNRMDVAANYNFVINKVRIKLGLSIINLLNAQNYNDIYTREFNFDATEFNETTYVESLGFTPNFFLNFQF